MQFGSLIKQLKSKAKTDAGLSHSAGPGSETIEPMVNPFNGQPMDSETVAGSDDPDGDALLADFSDPELQAADKHSKKRFGIDLPIGKSFSLLVFQAGSFGLRCALARKVRQGVQFGAVVESDKVDFTQAIADVLNQLKAHQRILPKKAILLTPSVISAVVDLPVSPLRPRSDDEMQELIRWELEGAVSQQNKQWLIGSMLVERGYLTAVQRDQIVAELQLRQSQSGESGVAVGLIRFGELAIELGYIDREHLDECFALQAKLVSLDDELIYGWQAEEQVADRRLSDEALLSKEEDSGSAHPWLVCGMSKTIRRRWLGAFALNNIRVEAFYPALGSSFAVLANTADAKVYEQLLLEVHQEQLVAITGSAQAVRRIQVAERQPGELRPEELAAVLGELPDEHNKIYLNLQGSKHEALLFALESGYRDREFVQLHYPQGVGGVVAGLQLDQLTGMVGAAEHFLGVVAAPALSWIQTRDAEPSLLKKIVRPKVLKLTAITCAAVCMVGFNSWMYWNWGQQVQRLAALNAQFDQDIQLKNQFANIRAEQAVLAEKIKTLQADNAENTALLTQVTKASARQLFLAGIVLKAISVSVTDGVVVRSISRKGHSLHLNVDSVSDAEAQQFAVTLSKVLTPSGFTIQTSEQQLISDAADVYVYRLNIQLIELADSVSSSIKASVATMQPKVQL